MHIFNPVRPVTSPIPRKVDAYRVTDILPIRTIHLRDNSYLTDRNSNIIETRI